MKQIVVRFDGVDFTLADRDLDSVLDEIRGLVAAGVPTWFEVNRDAGRLQPARILLTAASQVMVAGIADPTPDAGSTESGLWRSEGEGSHGPFDL